MEVSKAICSVEIGLRPIRCVEDNKAPLRKGAGCAVAVVLSFRKVKKPRSLERDVSKRQVYRLMRGVQKGNRTLPRLIEPTLVTAQ